jgi:DNA invertase Pin-like site-specific DNA recombinase
MDNRLVGYARVSTDDQTTRQQLDELKAAGCTEIFEDVISGASTERAGLDACLEMLAPGDTLVVVALDRIGRSTSHVIATVATLGKRGVGFKSLREPMYDTTSPTGEFLLTIFAGLAQLERRMIAQRTKSALAAKKNRGEKLGRQRDRTATRNAQRARWPPRGPRRSRRRAQSTQRPAQVRAHPRRFVARGLHSTQDGLDFGERTSAFGAAVGGVERDEIPQRVLEVADSARSRISRRGGIK